MKLKMQAIELYTLCFPDDPVEFAEGLTEKYFDSCCRYLTADGRIVSMLYLFDGKIFTPHKTLPAKYIYAAATHPDYRGRGYMSRLIEEVKKDAEDEGATLTLKPATHSLFGYYSKFGFKTAFYSMKGGASEDMSSVSLPEYLIKREKLMDSIPHFSFNTLYEDVFGDHILKIGSSGCLAVSADNNTVTEQILYGAEMDAPYGMALPPKGTALPDKMYMGPAWE